MPSDLKYQEKRRSDRVLIRVPVQVKAVAHDGQEVAEDAETAVVSRFGALIRIPSLLKMGSTLRLTNHYSQLTETFKVVWLAEEQTDGRWDTGVEAQSPQEDFWGIRFPTAASSKDRKA